MFRIRKTKSFDAAHQLKHHDGKCKGLHGHTYSVTIEVEGSALCHGGPKRGLLLDYYDMGRVIERHVLVLDHRFLNDIFENPTSELMAQALYKSMSIEIRELTGGRARLSMVSVSETPTSRAEYRP